MANEIFTRIQLKYDSWSKWDLVADKFVPLQGEVCIVNPGENTTACLLKVGDGTTNFRNLPWLSALAADVAAWAKAADVRLKDQKLEFFTTTAEGDVIAKTVDLSAFATEAEVNALLAGYKPLQTAVPDPTADGKSLAFIASITQDAQGVITATKKNVNLDDYALKTETGVISVNKKDGTAIEVDNADPKNPKIGFKINTAAGDVTLTQDNDGLKANLNKAKAGLDKVENKSTATIKSEFTGAVADGNTGFVTGDAVHDAIATAVEELTVGAHTYEVTGGDDITVTPTTANTKTTFNVATKIVKDSDINGGAGGYKNALIKYSDLGLYVPEQKVSLDYDEATMTYIIKQEGFDADQWSHTSDEIGRIVIPEDMVVKSGEVVTKTESGKWGEAGTYIALTLATENSDIIYINVGNLIEYVTSGSKTGDMVFVDVSADHKVTATITDGTITKAKLFSTVQSSLDKADTAIQSISNDGESLDAPITFNFTKYNDGLAYMNFWINDGAVETKHIADKSVTAAKLADDVKELIKTEAATLDAVILAESQKYTNDAIDDLHAIATSGSIYDVAEGSTANNGADKVAHPKYLIFNCGSSTEVI